MTSAVSAEDVRFAAYAAGIKNPARLDAFMKTVHLYAFALARKMSGIEDDAPPVVFQGEKTYLCRSCGVNRQIGEFPESKRLSPSKNVGCNHCQDRRKYKCTGPCQQYKPLADFPEKKQARPHIPSPCSYCAPKTITMEDARDMPTVP